MKRLVPVLLATALLVACSSSGPEEKSGISGAITVDAAASLTGAFTTLKANFQEAHPGARVKLTFGASSDLSTQIQQGAPVDVFASASIKNMDALGAAAVDPKDFAANTGEIAVPPSNPADIATVQDLAKPGVKVAVCDPTVPCGVVATTVFANAKTTVKPVASLADVKSTLAAVESGEVDAGIVYVTDVRGAKGKVTGVPIPDDVNAGTTYPIAALTHAKNGTLAKAWVGYVLSAEGQQVLKAAGFQRP
jgi:molybdate transport system substrate-binding protein